MCLDPATGTLLITAGTALTGLAQQDQAVSAQNQFNDQQRQNTIHAMNENLSQIELAKQQATTQAGQKQFENTIAMQKAQSTARTTAGENGVAGLSVDALLSEIEASGLRYNDSVSANLKDSIDNLNTQRTSASRNAASQVNQLKAPQAPDYIGAALRIGGEVNDFRKAQQQSQQGKK